MNLARLLPLRPSLLSKILTAAFCLSALPPAQAHYRCLELVRPALTRADVTAIREYVTVYNHEINQMLRDQVPWNECPDCEVFFRSLVRALQKMPAQENTVYRGARLSPRSELRQAIEDGSESYTERSFMSTSLDRAVAEKFAGEGDRAFLFVIHGKNGRAIHQLVDGTKNESGKTITEKEVIFLPGTKFLIRGVDRSGKITIVELEEH